MIINELFKEVIKEDTKNNVSFGIEFYSLVLTKALSEK